MNNRDKPFELKTSDPTFSGFPRDALVPPVEHDRDSQITRGDLHGNFLALLHDLIAEGVIDTSPENWEELKKIFIVLSDPKQLDNPVPELKAHLARFLEILKPNKSWDGEFTAYFKIGLIRLMGDDFSDRVGNDGLTLYALVDILFDALPVKDLISNHTFELIISTLLAGEDLPIQFKTVILTNPTPPEGVIYPSTYQTMTNLQKLVDRKVIPESEVKRLVKKLLTKLVAVDTSMHFATEKDKAHNIPTVVIYTHAPNGLELLKGFADTYFKDSPKYPNISFNTDSPEDIFKLCDEINKLFQEHPAGSIYQDRMRFLENQSKLEQTIKELKEHLEQEKNQQEKDNLSQKISELEAQLAYHDSETIPTEYPFYRLIWNRPNGKLLDVPTDKLLGKPGSQFKVHFVHGHDKHEQKGMTCLDHDFGKSREQLIEEVNTNKSPTEEIEITELCGIDNSNIPEQRRGSIQYIVNPECKDFPGENKLLVNKDIKEQYRKKHKDTTKDELKQLHAPSERKNSIATTVTSGASYLVSPTSGTDTLTTPTSRSDVSVTPSQRTFHSELKKSKTTQVSPAPEDRKKDFTPKIACLNQVKIDNTKTTCFCRFWGSNKLEPTGEIANKLISYFENYRNGNPIPEFTSEELRLIHRNEILHDIMFQHEELRILLKLELRREKGAGGQEFYAFPHASDYVPASPNPASPTNR